MVESGCLLCFSVFHCFEATLMPATVNFHRLTTYKNLLKDGYMYSLSGFDITRCNQNCRLSGSLLLIRFSDSTRLDELTEQVIPIPDSDLKKH
ncbi:unnamed protein product [Brassica oleracea]